MGENFQESKIDLDDKARHKIFFEESSIFIGGNFVKFVLLFHTSERSPQSPPGWPRVSASLPATPPCFS